MIDWNDFTICETIDFAEDDRIDKVFEKGIQRFDKMDFKGVEQPSFCTNKYLLQSNNKINQDRWDKQFLELLILNNQKRSK